MPRVKIDYVVSFSSEDPEHPASNLLAWEVSKKKWLCKKGESSCSVVLQLTKAVKISSVHIGAYHSALVEVLVARSEDASDQYQVLVPSCVFVSPSESRRDEPAARVRSFSAAQLAAARHQRWDRVRVVCSQPYNKHCKYGLSFIHVDEPGDAPAPAVAVPPRLLALDTFSSDEDEFRPGELFAEHLQRNTDSQGSASDTGAQIRQATSQALKNISDPATKLMKTPISKRSAGQRSGDGAAAESTPDRARDSLVYTRDDERPHARIDRVLRRHRDEQAPAGPHDTRERKDKENEGAHGTNAESRTKRKKSASPPASGASSSNKCNKLPSDATSSDRKNRTDETRKRPRRNSEEPERAGEESAEPHTLLKGVVLVLSGYENPERARVRNTALAMGARVERDWGPTCTHLICAFPNTPKLRQVRASSGPSVPAVLADWLLQCSARRRRLPWQWFATEPQHRRPEPAPTAPPSQARAPAAPPRDGPPPPRDDSDTECDTDDEIEKVLQKQKAKQTAASSDDETMTASPSRHGHEREAPATHEAGSATDEAGAATDEAGAATDEAGSATDEDAAEAAEVPRFGGALPHFFDGHTFAIDADGPAADELARYLTAYGGLVLQMSQLVADSEVEYVVGGRRGGAGGARVSAGGARVSAGGARVSAGWVARCVRAGGVLPPDDD